MNIIYQIKNKLSEKVFIGYYCGKDKPLTSMRPRNIDIMNDIKELGKDSFNYEIIKNFDDKKQLIEQYKNILSREFLLSDKTYNNKCIKHLTVIDKDGKTLSIKNDDPRYLSGELIPLTKNKIVVRDKQNNYYSVSLNDPRYLSGELVSLTKNKVIVNDGSKNILLDKNDEKLKDGDFRYFKQGIKKYYDDKNNPIWIDENKLHEFNNLKREKHKEPKNARVNKLKNLYKDLNIDIDFCNTSEYKIKTLCEHNNIFTIKKFLFKQIIKNSYYPKIFCKDCLKDYLNDYILSNTEILDYKKILSKLVLNQFSEHYIKLKFPILHNAIDKINTTSAFKEKLFLWKNDLKEPPKCILENCNNHTNFSNSTNVFNKYCLKHSYYSTLSSDAEKEIFDWVSSVYKEEIIRNYRKINGKEIDIFVPNRNFAIEYNGLYFHGEYFRKKTYHFDKWAICNNKNIKLFTIWEDDWKLKNDIIKSMILYNLGLSNEKIGARMCKIKEVSNNETKNFLNSNHLQGWCASSIRLGLYFENDLVSIMTFGKKRKIMNISSNENEYELLRFCNKLNFNVSGAATKLWKYFLKVYNPNDVLSYANLDISNGNLYKILGFKEIGVSINYWWAKNGIKYHRSNFMKHKLLKNGEDTTLTEDEIMKNYKFFKIYGTGNKKYQYIKI